MKLRHYFKKAQKEKWALGQFNFSTLSQLKGILFAAKELNSPIILGTSEGEARFFGLEEIVNLVKFYQRKFKTPIFLNLDHGKDSNLIKKAIDLGYDAVHFDGSELPFKENIKITKKVVKYAKKYGILVEGEVGRISTESSKVYQKKFKIKEADLTKPEDVKIFVKETNVDSLAVSIGTFHGVEITGINPKIQIERLKKIKNRAESAFLVLHGGSGTPGEDIKEAIKFGIVKVNINTELRLAFTNTLKGFFKKNPEEITPYKFLPSVILAVEKVVKEKIKLFRSYNKK